MLDRWLSRLPVIAGIYFLEGILADNLFASVIRRSILRKTTVTCLQFVRFMIRISDSIIFKLLTLREFNLRKSRQIFHTIAYATGSSLANFRDNCDI